MSKLFRIEEDDLHEMERILPELSQRLIEKLDNKLRTQLRRCQSILSNVRWGYGPATEVEVIPAGNNDEKQDGSAAIG